MIEFVGLCQARGTSTRFSYSGVASFEPSTQEVTWEASISTAEGRLLLRGTAQGVMGAPLTKATAMQAVADAIDQRFGRQMPSSS